MAFDREKLKPKYLLRVGETGESQALWIHKNGDVSRAYSTSTTLYLQ